MSDSRLHKLSAEGQSVWVDSLSREWLETGELERLIREDAVVGVTTNPSIFQKALSEGDRYDEQLRTVFAEEDDAKEVFLRLAVQDVQRACDVLRSVWDSGNGQDGYVSIEVDPALAHDGEATLEEAIRLHEWIERPNLHVKIPGTAEGLAPIEECIARGRSINVTLIFSLARYREVVRAYQRGIARLVESGGDPSTVASVASFFVSRVDTEADRRLEEVGTEEALALRGKLAVANAKLAYAHWHQAFSTDSWKELEEHGATAQRCLWASTSVKNPDYRDVLYVEELIGPKTVNTMPMETIRAFQDHGEVARTLDTGLDEAREVLAALEDIGVSYDDVTETLEAEGVQKFEDSFEQLLEGIQAKRGELVSA